MLCVNPLPSHQRKGKRRKRERGLQIEYKTALLIIILIILIIKEIKNIYKTDTEFLRVGCQGIGVQSAAARQHQEVLVWTQQ